MPIEIFIETYGYLALFIGTFLEGETVLIAGGVAAHTGHLYLPWVIVFAFLGSLAGDQFFFFLGRLKGAEIIRRRPAWQRRANRVNRLLLKYRLLTLFGYRYMYGLRSVTPFALGLTEIKARHFILINALSTLVWAVIIGHGGYYLGGALEVILGNVRRYQFAVIGTLIIAGFFMWLFHSRRKGCGATP
jgi:membrane protein DedA with SNARE-associated domain